MPEAKKMDFASALSGWLTVPIKMRAEYTMNNTWETAVSTRGDLITYRIEAHLVSASWIDHSRDVLHMINHFRDEMPRPLMGFGHSLGAVQA
jgi:hypothetical protein